jgi:hypothetical protein
VNFESYNPYSGGGTWYKGETHAHSTRSDGELSPTGLAARYDGLGFDFVAITDHHTVTKLKGNGILVLGQESGKGGSEVGEQYSQHMTALSISSSISEGLSMQGKIDRINAQGGLVVFNHPTTMFYSYDLNDLRSLQNYTALEIYNGYNDGILAGNPVGLWDDILSTGKRVWGVAGDDAHTQDDCGKGWIEVRVSGGLSTANILNAIKRGSFYASQGPVIDDLVFEGKTFTVSSPGADSIAFYGRDGRHLATVNGGSANYTINGNEGYVRAEVSEGGKKAWSQPVFVGTRSSGEPANNAVVVFDMLLIARASEMVR